jgi:CDP-diacylglycerol---serine O-phosphatidyltransferase
VSLSSSFAGRPTLQRGAAQLPSVLTVGNLFCGFAAVIQALHHEFAFAAQLVVLAGIFDVLDGRIARLTGTTSELGAELDSLADLVSFGVAPAVLAYEWGLVTHGEPFLAAFALVMCAALRLARFNVLRQTAEACAFTGLPSPAAAGMVVSIVALHPQPPVGSLAAYFVPGVLVLAGALMISPVSYCSFKKTKVTWHRYQVVAVVLVGLAAVVTEPAAVLFAVSWGYAAVPLASLAPARRRAPDGDGAPRGRFGRAA